MRLLVLKNYSYIRGLKERRETEYFSKFLLYLLRSLGFKLKTYQYQDIKAEIFNVSPFGIVRPVSILGILFFLVAIMWVFIAYLIQKPNEIQHTNILACKVYLITTELLFSFAQMYVIFQIRKLNDAYYVKFELLTTCTVTMILSPIIAIFHLHGTNRYISSTLAIVLCISSIFVIYLFCLFSKYFPQYLTYKHKKENFHLDTTYECPKLWAEFKAQLDKEYCTENAEFVERFDQLMVSSYTNIDLNRLYEDFISVSALNELNINHTIRDALQFKYKAGKLTLEDFHVVRNEAWKAMEYNNFPRFLNRKFSCKSVFEF